MYRKSRRKEKLKITISTRKRYLSSIRHGISEFIGNPEYNLEYFVSVKDVQASANDPIVRVVISAIVSGVVGAAAKSFFDWMRSRRRRERGFGHVKYKTLGIARCEARYDLEHVHNINDYEEVEAHAFGWNFSIIFRDSIGRTHTYSISPSCALKSYSRS